MPPQPSQLIHDPLWYKDAIIYELHVKSFHDSDGDGVGDFQGLTQKLDYLQSLGINAIWLLPFYPSPFRDDGYDIADYYSIHPQYGTMADFKKFLREAHRRGLRVITELVLNHTSDQHPWFQQSRRAEPGSYWHNFYVWSEAPNKYLDARIIFKDFESSNWTYDSKAKMYYWHRFYSHQPDLNFENPQVIKAVLRVLDHWFNLGVDGLRLDAVPYLFEQEGTNCENLPETYQFLEQLRAHVDQHHKDKMLLAEANQWPDDAVAYFAGGNRCHMAFHFPLMPRLFMGTWMEDRFPIIDIFEQTPSIPDSCQWALFLRNHDELTLEMVSDEERDYMYRVYAKDPSARINLGIRRRLAPLLGNNRRKIEIMNMLLLSLPGTPIIYYGDELGMGDNHYLGDRNGVRTPMQWNADRNAGFSRANPQQLFLPAIIDPDYHYEAINVESLERNQSSLLWWMRRVIAMRKRFKAFGRGTIEFVHSDNPKVISFIRRWEDETILVVMNLSRFSQVAELDLAQFDGFIPSEVMSGNKFPVIRSAPYVITLGFYDYFWFTLSREEQYLVSIQQYTLPKFEVHGSWEAVFHANAGQRFEREVLPSYLPTCRWFAAKARTIKNVRILDRIPVHYDAGSSHILLIEVRYTEGSNEIYLLPVSFDSVDAVESLMQHPGAVVALVDVDGYQGAVFDASHDDEFRSAMLSMITRKQSARGAMVELSGQPGRKLKGLQPRTTDTSRSTLGKAEQSNSSFTFDGKEILKLFRKLDEGINPDIEIGRFLTEEAGYTHTPAFLGDITLRRKGLEPIAGGILQQFVPNEGDAWSYSLSAAGDYFSRVLSKRNELQDIPPLPSSIWEQSLSDAPPLFQELIGGLYLEMAGIIGRRTGELHLVLGAASEESEFAPEPFSLLYQKSVFHSMRTLTKRTFELLRRSLKHLGEVPRREGEVVLKHENRIIDRFARILERKIEARKIRIHGDLHLGQLLFTGNDFYIIDFEGEPARSLSERRLKRSPFRDVSGMIRSFHYPPYSVLMNEKTLSPLNIESLFPWAHYWSQLTSAAFLRSYMNTIGNAEFVSDADSRAFLLEMFLLEKAVYEVQYELNNRPDWVVIPLQGIRHIVED